MRDVFPGLLLAAFLACNGGEPPPAVAPAPLAAPPGSRFPGAARRPDGSLLAWWTRPREGGLTVLEAAAVDAREPTRPVELAAFRDGLVNWADGPRVCEHPGGERLVTWLVRTGRGASYAVHARLFGADGRALGDPFLLHDDRGPGEHGFVALVARPEGFRAFWLDGSAAGGPGGATALRTRVVGLDGVLGPETVLDDRVCDCCALDAVAVPEGVLVAYRDRDRHEVRDISIGLLRPDGAFERRFDSGDRWTMPGCPVNGPALACRDDRVALAWTTGSGRDLRVRLALSEDGGATFCAPIDLPTGPTLGRVDLTFARGDALLVSWLSLRKDDAVWTVGRLAPDGALLETVDVLPAAASRASGFARLLVDDEGAARLFATTPDDPPRAVARSVGFDS